MITRIKIVLAVIAAFLLFASLVLSLDVNFFPSKSWTTISVILAFLATLYVPIKLVPRIRAPYQAHTGRIIGRATQIWAIIFVSMCMFLVSWGIARNLAGRIITENFGQAYNETTISLNGIQERMKGKNGTRRPYRFINIIPPQCCWGNQLLVPLETPLSRQPQKVVLNGTRSFTGFMVESFTTTPLKDGKPSAAN